MRNLSVLALVSLCTLSTACEADPGKNQPKAEAAAPVAPVAKPPAATAQKYAVTATNSQVEFVGAKITDTHEGKFSDFSGAVDLVEGDIKKSSIAITIQTASLSIEPPKLAGHLKSGDFFDVEKFPTASFQSGSIVTGVGADEFKVTGNLTMHGVTKAVSFPATIKKNGDALAVDTQFTINRKDFGIVYPGMPDDLIKDDVLLRIKMSLTKS